MTTTHTHIETRLATLEPEQIERMDWTRPLDEREQAVIRDACIQSGCRVPPCIDNTPTDDRRHWRDEDH